MEHMKPFILTQRSKGKGMIYLSLDKVLKKIQLITNQIMTKIWASSYNVTTQVQKRLTRLTITA